MHDPWSMITISWLSTSTPRSRALSRTVSKHQHIVDSNVVNLLRGTQPQNPGRQVARNLSCKCLWLAEHVSSYTLRVPCHFNPSSSPSSYPSTGFDPGPVVDISRGVFHFRLETFLIFYPILSLHSRLSLFTLISWNLTTRSLVVTGGDSVVECGTLSQLLSGAL